MTLDQLSIGVISGLVSAALFGLILFLIRTVWKRHIEPWWENKVYSDARIDGQWMSSLHTQSTQSDRELIAVTQTGHNIEGDIQCVSGPDEGRAYKFVGCIKNQILSAYYWNVDRRSIDSGSFSLRLEADGGQLKGHTVYYHDLSHSLVSREYTWTREKIPAESSSIESLAPSESAVQQGGTSEVLTRPGDH